MRRYYLLPIGVIVLQLVTAGFLLWSLCHFYDRPWWIQAINSLTLPMCVFNAYRIARTTLEIRQLEKEHQVTMARLRRVLDTVDTMRRAARGPDELEQYIREIEELDSAMGADLRKNLGEFLKK